MGNISGGQGKAKTPMTRFKKPFVRVIPDRKWVTLALWSKLCTVELYRLGRASTPLWEACQVSTASATLLNSERHIQDPERTGIVQSTEGADQSTLFTTQLGSGLSTGSSPFLLATLPLLTWVALQREEAVGHREQAQHGLRRRQQLGWGRVQ